MESQGRISVDERQSPAERTLTGIRNRCLMRLLERIASEFNEAGVPLLVLKGAALNLTVYETPCERPMSDLDLLIRPEHVGEATRLLEKVGCLRGEPLVREDFFPQYHYEVDFNAKTVYPMKIDLHVRPFRPLRYSRIVPAGALWDRARPIRIGRATVLIPSNEDMLLHLAVHAAVHGFSQEKWLEDIKRWTEAYALRIDWEQFVSTAAAWKLALPVGRAMRMASQAYEGVCPPAVLRRLRRLPVNWRDRLALWHAPRDAARPVWHVAVNFLTTPGRWFMAGYLLAMLIPGRDHMADWYCRRHRGWLPIAHLLRWTWPIIKHLPRLRSWFSKIEIRPSRVHGIGVFAVCDIKAGEVIARCSGKAMDRSGMYTGWHEVTSGRTQHYEITGPLKFLNHSCSPNAQLPPRKLVALRPIRAGAEITISYGNGACKCRTSPQILPKSSSQGFEVAA